MNASTFGLPIKEETSEAHPFSCSVTIGFLNQDKESAECKTSVKTHGNKTNRTYINVETMNTDHITDGPQFTNGRHISADVILGRT